MIRFNTCYSKPQSKRDWNIKEVLFSSFILTVVSEEHGIIMKKKEFTTLLWYALSTNPNSHQFVLSHTNYVQQSTEIVKNYVWISTEISVLRSPEPTKSWFNKRQSVCMLSVGGPKTRAQPTVPSC